MRATDDEALGVRLAVMVCGQRHLAGSVCKLPRIRAAQKELGVSGTAGNRVSQERVLQDPVRSGLENSRAKCWITLIQVWVCLCLRGRVFPGL